MLTPIAPGPICTAGGMRIDVGVDTNDNGALDPSEIQQTGNVCNGGQRPVSADGGTPSDGGATTQTLQVTASAMPSAISRCLLPDGTVSDWFDFDLKCSSSESGTDVVCSTTVPIDCAVIVTFGQGPFSIYGNPTPDVYCQGTICTVEWPYAPPKTFELTTNGHFIDQHGQTAAWFDMAAPPTTCSGINGNFDIWTQNPLPGAGTCPVGRTGAVSTCDYTLPSSACDIFAITLQAPGMTWTSHSTPVAMNNGNPINAFCQDVLDPNVGPTVTCNPELLPGTTTLNIIWSQE